MLPLRARLTGKDTVEAMHSLFLLHDEALVLLVSLTHSNEEVQKIAAFEGVFDR